ncbi:OsmC family protein [Pelotomaculum propionicicum]|uniref:OsmC-like protein n=1 Tax=Pelotomaculum propionicicum TaxID=258475 RepID=A0A4Y7RVF6_9FIRM|nr:OsmC family protein [Pelotomaculum propionicicum]TEB12965.1 hypothetical protein Pmgp_00603 [Pelotomaculum propionicicum]
MVKVITTGKPYSCLVTDGVHQLQADTILEYGGGNAGFRPHDLLAAALGTCQAISVRMYASNHGIPVRSVTVEVEIDRTTQDKTVFRKIISIEGDISEDERKNLYNVATTCPVQQTLSQQLEFVIA